MKSKRKARVQEDSEENSEQDAFAIWPRWVVTAALLPSVAFMYYARYSLMGEKVIGAGCLYYSALAYLGFILISWIACFVYVSKNESEFPQSEGASSGKRGISGFTDWISSLSPVKASDTPVFSYTNWEGDGGGFSGAGAGGSWAEDSASIAGAGGADSKKADVKSDPIKRIVAIIFFALAVVATFGYIVYRAPKIFSSVCSPPNSGVYLVLGLLAKTFWLFPLLFLFTMMAVSLK